MSGIERDPQSREKAHPLLTRKGLRGPPGAVGRSAPSLIPGKAKGEPRLRVLVHEDAREILIDANEFIADSVAAINVSHQSLKFIVRDRLLIFLQQLPLRRIGQRSAEEIDCKCGKALEEKKGAEEDPQVKMTRDHGLDFHLFNTMLAGC